LSDPPFDFEFRLDDSAFYCLELTEKAFRSQGLKLSEPVRIGDWEFLSSFPLTAVWMPGATRLAVGSPITLDQPVYVPGNDRQGTWGSDSNGEKNNDLPDDRCSEPLSQTMVIDKPQEFRARPRDFAGP
jgi:hypothetical protein